MSQLARFPCSAGHDGVSGAVPEGVSSSQPLPARQPTGVCVSGPAGLVWLSPGPGDGPVKASCLTTRSVTAFKQMRAHTPPVLFCSDILVLRLLFFT